MRIIGSYIICLMSSNVVEHSQHKSSYERDRLCHTGGTWGSFKVGACHDSGSKSFVCTSMGFKLMIRDKICNRRVSNCKGTRAVSPKYCTPLSMSTDTCEALQSPPKICKVLQSTSKYCKVTLHQQNLGYLWDSAAVLHRVCSNP
jgi:hypothetical protein